MKLRKVPDTLGRETHLEDRLGRERPARCPRSPASSSARRGPRRATTATEGPILDPADRRFSWKDATLWAVTAGIGLGIAKLISARLAVAGWEVATGTLPPGVEEPVEI